MRKSRLTVLCACCLACGTHLLATTITGQVTDHLGQPAPNVDLDFIDVVTGNDESVNNGATDPTGHYTVIIDPGIYDVFFRPPTGIRLAGHLEPSVNLNVDQVVNVVLEEAWFVSGHILRADTGLPAMGVDLDFEDVLTGEKIFTPADNTNIDGLYDVRVPKGIYQITFDGPEPDLPADPLQLAHGHLEEISVDGSGDISLPTAVLELGFLVEGLINDDKGDAVFGVDLNFFLAGTEQKIFSKNDNTNANGFYETIVPAGTYDIEFNPPAGSDLAAERRVNVVIAGDTILGIDVLDEGVSVSGFVRDPDGEPLRDVDLDFELSSTLESVPTTWDDTDETGHYLLYVKPGIFNIDYGSLVNTLVDATISSGVAVPFSTVLPDVVLPFHDEDGDGVADVTDNCPFRPNPLQENQDLDAVGNVCDNCPLSANSRQEDNDLDRSGDVCDDDDDNDGEPDVSDVDVDGDLVANAVDNCPQAHNPDQSDSDGDGPGDACDPDDGEVEYLEARSRNGFAWRPEIGALGYKVYRQRLAWLSSLNYGTCAHDAPNGTVFLADDPNPGEGLAILVTAETPTGEGGLGRSSGGVERPNLRSCP